MVARKKVSKRTGKTTPELSTAVANSLIARCTTFGIPNYLARMRAGTYVDNRPFKTFHDQVENDWKADLQKAVCAIRVAELSLGTAIVSLLEVQKALLPIVADDPILGSRLAGDSPEKFRKAYVMMAPLFSELPKLQLIFGIDLNMNLFRAAEENGVEIDERYENSEWRKL